MALSDYAFKIFAVFVVIIGWYIIFQRKCHNLEPTIYSRLGSKRPYRAVANFDSTPIKYEGCTPKKIWAMIRHGTRTPKTKVNKKMREKLKFIKFLINQNTEGNLCPEVKSAIRNWNLEIKDEDHLLLTSEGEQEMLLLGQRLKRRFPEILNQIYSNDTYYFRYTMTERTKKSANSFVAGLFGNDAREKVSYPESLYNDPILRFSKLCEKWKKTISKNESTFKESNLFKNSDIMAKAVLRISKRIGLEEKISFDDVLLMFNSCGYESAWNENNISPWCMVFSEEEAKLIEYHDDLRFYWKHGYGFSLNYKQACPTFNDMMEHFRNKSSGLIGKFYFSHSGILLKMLAFLGLYKDYEELRSDNYDNHLERKWKASEIDTFGTNLVFVLYSCDDGKDKILILHQEKPVRIPGCPKNEDLCPIANIYEIFKSSFENCNFNEMCSV